MMHIINVKADLIDTPFDRVVVKAVVIIHGATASDGALFAGFELRIERRVCAVMDTGE